jgi:hypothetical protein
MRISIGILAITLLLTSCKNDPQHVAYTSDVVTIHKPNYSTEVNLGEVADTTNIPEIDMSAPADIVITLNTDGVSVDAANYSAHYSPNEYSRVVVSKMENNVNHVKVDNTTLFYSPITKYKYLDANTIEVQEGNTLLGIVRDHKLEGYSITLDKLLKCNQFLSNRGKAKTIYPGDLVRLQCD